MADIYVNGDYGASNPSWHERDAPWKALQVRGILDAQGVEFESMIEVGCGTGEILVQLSRRYPTATFEGWDISPQALELTRGRESDRVSFHLGDPSSAGVSGFDVVLVADVVEHVDDPFAFVRGARGLGRRGVFHIPLDVSVQSVLRNRPMLNLRRTVGHIHYFTKDTALALLTDCSWRVVHWRYTASRLELGDQARSSRLVAPLRRVLFRVAPDFTVRVLGGYSLLVLVE